MRRPSRTLLAATSVALLLAACGSDDGADGADEAGIETPPVDEAPEPEPEPEPAPEPDDAGDDAPEAPVDPAPDGEVAPPDDEDDPADDDGATDDAGDAAPAPDADLVATPCAAHDTRTMENFIEVAAPVDGQQVRDTVEVVGCSNVFEANIVWTVLDEGGAELDTGTFTAECGSGCVGEFRDELDLRAADGLEALTVVLSSPDVSDDEGVATFAEVSIDLVRP